MWALLRSSFVQAEFAHAVLVPAAAAMLVAVLSAVLASRTPHLGRRLALFAIPAAFLAGYFETYRNFTFPPATVLSWLPWFILALVAIDSLPDTTKRGAMAQLARVLASAAAAALLLWPILNHEAWPLALATGVGVTILWALPWAVAGAAGVAQPALASALLVVSLACALAAPLSGSVLLGQFAAALAAALGGSILIARLTRRAAPLEGVPAAIFILSVLLVDLRFYAGAAEGVVAGLFVSIIAGLAGSMAAHRYRLQGSRALGIAVLATLVPATYAIVTAFRLSQAGGGY